MGRRQTLLVVLAHPDDEVLAAGTILAQRARGDRVVVVWLTRGEMTQAFGSLEPDEVVARRVALGRKAGELLGVETRFLTFPDTAVEAGPEGARRVARIVADVRPDGLLTWGSAWVRGMRHPDHAATGRIARDAITLARIAKVVEPGEPHRAHCPVFTLRGAHSTVPPTAVDVTAHLDLIFELAGMYREALGFGDPEWLRHRLTTAGERWGVQAAEELDAWESRTGLVPALLPTGPGSHVVHAERDAVEGSESRAAVDELGEGG